MVCDTGILSSLLNYLLGSAMTIFLLIYEQLDCCGGSRRGECSLLIFYRLIGHLFIKIEFVVARGKYCDAFLSIVYFSELWFRIAVVLSEGDSVGCIVRNVNSVGDCACTNKPQRGKGKFTFRSSLKIAHNKALVCQSIGAHFPAYVFHSHNSPQTQGRL